MSSQADTVQSNGLEAHGHLDDGRVHQWRGPSKRGAFRAMVQDFSPLWFTWCMNAGIIAILMHQEPYQFWGLGVLSTIAFLADFVFFIFFSIIMLLRLILFRRQAYHELVGDTSELTLLACWPVAWLTLTAFVALNVSGSSWGGHHFTIVAYVMWWIGAAWMLATLLFVFIALIRRRTLAEQPLPPTILIPTVGLTTVATIGGVVSTYSTAISARMAVPVIITSFCFVGLGLFMALIFYAQILQQLLHKGWPQPEQTATLFVLVGPMGQGSAALQLLGSAASTYGRFAGYNKGSFLTEAAGPPLEMACVLIALLLTGISVIGLVLALYAMFERAFNKELTWAPTWNSIIFPTGTLATSFLYFSMEMDSPFFRTMMTILLLFMISVFFLNLAFTAWKISQGQILVVREDPRMKQDGDDQKQR
ncbi:hypothetical protein LTR84_012435 [Exophiala bonariae]|uniref:C4-dicarboxylate transporter/malic acid transporter n=1 Tax=Exophiala bonariae TaxID=1690606 RepID=A0AAV9MTZ7_9EURO|nr:hypothetical protein LTR84_012435 [Exophiala bonariae]